MAGNITKIKINWRYVTHDVNAHYPWRTFDQNENEFEYDEAF